MWKRLGLVGATTLLVCVGGGAHAAPVTSTLDLAFNPAQPHTPANLALHIIYRRPSDPDGKPSPIRHLEIEAPPGTTFDTSAVPVCTATDQQIQLLGRQACPAASQVGTGTLTVMEGFGPPFDPVTTDAVIFNGGTGIIETFTAHGTPGPVIALDRITISGSRLTGNPPAEPGGPPDGQTAVREIAFTFPASTHFVITPQSCPGANGWTSSGTFTFADGTTQTATSTSPCVRPAADATTPARPDPAPRAPRATAPRTRADGASATHPGELAVTGPTFPAAIPALVIAAALGARWALRVHVP